jgi:hypothetical protein
VPVPVPVPVPSVRVRVCRHQTSHPRATPRSGVLCDESSAGLENAGADSLLCQKKKLTDMTPSSSDTGAPPPAATNGRSQLARWRPASQPSRAKIWRGVASLTKCLKRTITPTHAAAAVRLFPSPGPPPSVNSPFCCCIFC